jgi:hypothetical protein
MAEPEKLPIMVRGFVPAPPSDPKSDGNKRKPAPPSEWTLVFDCETEVDAAQALRFGAYQMRKDAKLIESGLFYDPDAIHRSSDLELLCHIAADRGVKLLTSEKLVHDVFYGMAYEFRANIVGFNLPFDLSRLAIWHHSAKGKTMKGGLPASKRIISS